MSSHGETYQHLIGKHVDEVTEALKADGKETRVYQQRGIIRSDNPDLVQLQVDPETQKVQKIS